MLQVGLMRSIAISSKVCKDCALSFSLWFSLDCAVFQYCRRLEISELLSVAPRRAEEGWRPGMWPRLTDHESKVSKRETV